MRRDGWESRLAQLVERTLARPFAWGENDCVTFAFEGVRALNDADPFAPFRGIYSTEFGAARALTEQGFGSVRGLAEQLLGEPIRPALAQRGDVVLWNHPTVGDTLGLCIGATAVFVGESGLVSVSMNQVLSAWRVA